MLMSLAILCIISVWHAIVTLWDPDADAEMFNVARGQQSTIATTLGVTAPTIIYAANQTIKRVFNQTTMAMRTEGTTPLTDRPPVTDSTGMYNDFYSILKEFSSNTWSP